MAIAHGTFDVELAPASQDGQDGQTDLPGVAQQVVTKRFHDDLIGTATGHMIGRFNQETNQGAYVLLEVIDGTLEGRPGTFAMVHQGVMDGENDQQLSITIVPGSGTGGLAGISGELELTITDNGVHLYDLTYDLPSQ